jgi:hypothetical protein
MGHGKPRVQSLRQLREVLPIHNVGQIKSAPKPFEKMFPRSKIGLKHGRGGPMTERQRFGAGGPMTEEQRYGAGFSDVVKKVTHIMYPQVMAAERMVKRRRGKGLKRSGAGLRRSGAGKKYNFPMN